MDAGKPVHIRKHSSRTADRGASPVAPVQQPCAPSPLELIGTQPGPSLDASIVIVNYNGLDHIHVTLDALTRQRARPLEVIVVDNASSDGSPEMILERFPFVRLVRSGANLGFSGGCNLGIAAARGRWIVLLNPDTRPAPEWLGALVRKAATSPVGDLATSTINTANPVVHGAELDTRLNILGYLHRVRRQGGGFAFAASGAAMCFEKVEYPRPFADDYFLYHEDVALSWHARLLGRTVRVAEDSVVEHEGSTSTSKVPALTRFHQEKNRLTNCLLFFEDRTLALLAPLLVADVAGHLVLRPRATWKALRWVVRNAPRIRERRRAIQASRRLADDKVLADVTASLINASTAITEMGTRIGATYCRILGLACLETRACGGPERA